MPGSGRKRSVATSVDLWPILVGLAPSVLLQGKRGHVSEGRVRCPVSKGQSPVP